MKFIFNFAVLRNSWNSLYNILEGKKYRAAPTVFPISVYK